MRYICLSDYDGFCYIFYNDTKCVSSTILYFGLTIKLFRSIVRIDFACAAYRSIKDSFIHVFLQCHKDEIETLPEVLAGKVDLLPDFLLSSRAANTSQKYEYGFIRWKKWALVHGLGSGDILPAGAIPFALYLMSLTQTANTASPVTSAFYSIKWFHDLCGLTSPTSSTIVVNILESAKRILAKPTVKKEVMTVDILSAMYDRLFEPGNLKSQRIICASLLAFAGFLRSSELLNILHSDLNFHLSYLSIFLESSKTDKYRDGSWILIARTGTKLCPVVNLEKYVQWAKFDGSDFLFCNLSKTKTAYKTRLVNKAMSYTNLRDQFIAAFSPHVSDISKFCLHSLRSGGASAAANHGIKDRMFKRHGRWTSETAKDGYVKDDLNELLSVSRSLGL